MKEDPKNPVRDFRCAHCDVVVKGARNERGEIHATNRPYTDSVVDLCICISCDIRLRGDP